MENSCKKTVLFNILYLHRNNVMLYCKCKIKHCYVGGVICNVYI